MTTLLELFVCVECEEPRQPYKDGVCKECWLSWQEWMDHLADGVSEDK